MTCPDVPELFRLWTSGVTMDDIAGQFGVSRTVIRAWRQRYKLPPRRSRFARADVDPTPDEIEERARECRERRPLPPADRVESRQFCWNGRAFDAIA